MVALTAGCGDGIVDWTVDSAVPYVPGIVERGGANEYLGELGNPQRAPASHSIATEDVYPNPTGRGMTLTFMTRVAGDATISVVRARGPSDLWVPSLGVMNGGALVGGRRALRHLELQLVPGLHSFVWELTDDAGQPVPDGFYRIYLRLGTDMQWWDVLVDRSNSWR